MDLGALNYDLIIGHNPDVRKYALTTRGFKTLTTVICY